MKQRKRATPLTPEKVAAIKNSYDNGSITTRVLCVLHSISPSTLHDLRCRHDWTPRLPRAPFFNSRSQKPLYANDAREQQDDADVLNAKLVLQRAGFVTYGKGPYMVGTRWLDREALLVKARRYGRVA